MIGIRTLTVALPAGEQPVIVTIFQPEGQGKSWTCRYAIGWPEGTTQHFARGVDALQAANLAQKMIGAELYTSGYHAKHQLRWDKVGDGYGFPVPNNIRDLLIGADKKYEA